MNYLFSYHNHKHGIFTCLPLIMLMLWLLNTPLQAQTTESVPVGSFIINMSAATPTVANSLRPYGLIHQLLREQNVPIKWVINPTKGKDGIDFTYLGVPYRGGPFIIYAQYRTPAVNAIINSWVTSGVQGVTTTSALTVPVYSTITYFVNWTLDSQNGAIAPRVSDKCRYPGYYVELGCTQQPYLLQRYFCYAPCRPYMGNSQPFAILE